MRLIYFSPWMKESQTTPLSLSKYVQSCDKKDWPSCPYCPIWKPLWSILCNNEKCREKHWYPVSGKSNWGIWQWARITCECQAVNSGTIHQHVPMFILPSGWFAVCQVFGTFVLVGTFFSLVATGVYVFSARFNKNNRLITVALILPFTSGRIHYLTLILPFTSGRIY